MLNQKPDGIISIITSSELEGSVGWGAKPVAAIQIETTGSCSSGIDISYEDFRARYHGDRKQAALAMAAELVSPNCIPGLTSISSAFDQKAASAAVKYGIDINNCPLVSAAKFATGEVFDILSSSAKVDGNVLNKGTAVFIPVGSVGIPLKIRPLVTAKQMMDQEQVCLQVI